ncbi:MAG: hypothetical protein ABI650_12025, partial [Dokdonella sp.]
MTTHQAPRNLRSATATTLSVALLTAAPFAHADAVTDWNLTTEQTAATAGPPPFQNRINTITHIAIHDALNAIRTHSQRYNPQPRAPQGTSPEAAVASVAYNTLRITAPAQAAVLEAIYEERVVGLPACPQAYPQ